MPTPGSLTDWLLPVHAIHYPHRMGMSPFVHVQDQTHEDVGVVQPKCGVSTPVILPHDAGTRTRTHPSRRSCRRARSARQRPSCSRPWRRRSPAARSTSTTASTRWAWPWTARRWRARRRPCRRERQAKAWRQLGRRWRVRVSPCQRERQAEASGQTVGRAFDTLCHRASPPL